MISLYNVNRIPCRAGSPFGLRRLNPFCTMNMFALLAFLLLGACGPDIDLSPGMDVDEGSDFPWGYGQIEGESPPIENPVSGYIGGGCGGSSDCDYDNSLCLDLPGQGGVCSLTCEEFCPDRAGVPTTFCVDFDAWAQNYDVDAGSDSGEGLCLSQCDYQAFPGNGCPGGFDCTFTQRVLNPQVVRSTCMPDNLLAEELTQSNCRDDLAALGINVVPLAEWIDPLPGDPDDDCFIIEPVVLPLPVVGGTHFVDGTYTQLSHLIGSCEMLRSAALSSRDAKSNGANTIVSFGTYNCRTIAGSNTRSNHGTGDAIDIAGFIMEDGSEISLIRDWDSRENPSGSVGQWLAERVNTWFGNEWWDTALTPDFNAAHADHFHLDITRGGSRYIN